MALIAASLSVGLGGAFAPRARADEPAPAEDAEEAELPPKRVLPDFDGREDPALSPGARAAWVPRLVLSPVYFVMESVVRQPMSLMVPAVEEAGIAERAIRFFHFGPGERLVLAPYFSYDFGFRPNVGLSFRASDVGTPGNVVHMTGATGGKRWYAGHVGDFYSIPNTRLTIGVAAEAVSRPDGAYYGISPDVVDGRRGRYHWFGTTTALSLRVRLLEHSGISFRVGHRYRRFDNNTGKGSRSLEAAVEDGTFAELPPGYVTGYSLAFLETGLSFDSRATRPQPGSGGLLDLKILGAIDVREGAAQRSFLRYEGSVAGFLDVSGENHVLSASATFEFAQALRGEVPFTELAGLGGTGPLGAFTRPYLIGDSAAAFSVGYSWPIWIFLDGTLDFALGNAYRGYLEGFSASTLRMSGTVGIAAVKGRNQIAELLFGVGTDEFGDGPNVERYRVVVGSGRDF